MLQEDVFILTAIDLGPLKKLRIRHDNTRPYSSWYLDRVEIVDTKDDTTWVKLLIFFFFRIFNLRFLVGFQVLLPGQPMAGRGRG